jgi:hypothetical protein
MPRSRAAFTAADFRRLALSFDGAIEGSHMNHPDFRANGRIFATIHPDDRRGMVKLTPDEQSRFVEEHPALFTPENGAWGRQGCTRVDFAAADEETLGDALTLAWQQAMRLPPAAPRRPRRAAPRRAAPRRALPAKRR